MALDRWIALIILMMCMGYAYTAFFMMDDMLAPFMQRDPIWPSTFPKVLSVLGIVATLLILFGFEKGDGTIKAGEINYRRLQDYKIGQAAILLGLMVAYALLLRPLGFLVSTFSFLMIGSAILGERRFVLMIVVSTIAAGSVWYLVDSVLGIFLSPLPSFMNGGR